jgi:hypothetical protein
MRSLQQIAAVVAMNLYSLPQRLGTSLVTVIGIAGVVGVLICILAMAVGFARTVAGTGRSDRVIVLSDGALSESLSRRMPVAGRSPPRRRWRKFNGRARAASNRSMSRCAASAPPRRCCGRRSASSKDGCSGPPCMS